MYLHKLKGNERVAEERRERENRFFLVRWLSLLIYGHLKQTIKKATLRSPCRQSSTDDGHVGQRKTE